MTSSTPNIPMISICVVTYKRHALLKTTLRSILSQTFTDFEIVIGNNDDTCALSGNVLGCEDPRIRFVNHPTNLGLLPNMNQTMQLARGHYVTWLNDDDLYSPYFLEQVNSVIASRNFPPCVFSAYDCFHSEEEIQNPASESLDLKVYSGPEFLRDYLERKISVVGCYAVYEREYLQGIGGMVMLGSHLGLYSDNLLAIKAGLLNEVPFITAPLVHFRFHDTSISKTSTDLDLYWKLQNGLLSACALIFSDQRLAKESGYYTFLLLSWVLTDAVNVATRAKEITLRQVWNYFGLLARFFKLWGPSVYWIYGMALFIRKSLRLTLNLAKIRNQSLQLGT